MDVLEDKLKGLSLAQRSHQNGSIYLLHGALQPGGFLAVSCSDRTIRLQDRTTLDLLGEYRGHAGPLCGLTFAHTSSDLLYSGSTDGTVRAWDVRCPGTEAVQMFRGDPSHSFCSLDLNCSDSLLCAGTEQVDREDSFLVFWDCRKAGRGLLGVFSESHSDDITQVRFHPQDRDRLASGSTDGLVNVFDLSQGGEEEALLLTCNSDSSAGVVCWSGPDSTQLLCLSHDEGLHLWDVDQVDSDQPLTIFSCSDARRLTPLADKGSVDYLVGGMWLEEAQTLLVVGGSSSGDLHLMGCDSGGLSLLSSLEGGHTSTVRCFLWDAAGGSLITGGEDAQLLLWKPGGKQLFDGKSQPMKIDSALKVKSRPHRKHKYQREKK
ncbi:WD repeat-containing protein 89 [Nematolebias whitei]|uniref:WD repeat-containing protein 89 n=1 Tax=Nematolebias whitei TaxID=451745 RepID=UPI00189AB3D1|nr:WD repeat-containing protein 89 [Nematolebias whitei]